VSTTLEPAGTTAPGAISCPRCGAILAPEQDWCLRCGAAARTRLVPTPNWRLPLVLTAVLAVLALAVLAAAFVALSDDGGAAASSTTATTTTP
jgi:uncharacterized paraquat-inducible protein A